MTQCVSRSEQSSSVVHNLFLNVVQVKVHIKQSTQSEHHVEFFNVNLLAPELLFFLILAHPVYKMWIIQEPNMLELWNKLHFEEKKTESIYHV